MTFDTRISHKIDTEENWKTNNPILLKGELIIVIDESNTVHLKIGNGTSHYSELPLLKMKLSGVLSNLQKNKKYNIIYT